MDEKNGKEKIKTKDLDFRLLLSTPKEAKVNKKRRIEVYAEAMVSTPDKNAVEGKKILFFGTNPKDVLGTKTTNESGKALVRLHFNPRFEGQKLSIRAQIEGTKVEDEKERYLIPDFGSGVNKFFRTAAYSWNKKNAKIYAYIFSTCVFNALAVWALYFNREGASSAILVSGLIGALIYWRTLDKFNGLIGFGSILAFAYIFPDIFISSFQFTILFIVFMGMPFYAIEELTYTVHIEDDGGKPRLSWQKRKNFYPYYPIYFACFMIVINIIQTINVYIFPVQDIVYKTGMVLSDEEVYGSISRKSHLLDIVDWIIASIILFFYAVPGEVLDFIRGTKGIHEGVGVATLFQTIGEWIKKFFLGFRKTR